jgi:type IV secretory pathway TraG/TraD family ATPase VirD4
MPKTTNIARIEQKRLNVSPDLVAEVIKEALTSLYYQDVIPNDLFCEVKAKLDDEERENRDVWRYHFDVKVKWRKLGDNDCLMDIVVSESSDHATRSDCETRAIEILKEIQEYAEVATEAVRRQDKSTRFGSAKWATQTDLQRFGFLEAFDDDTDSSRFICGEFSAADADRPKLVTIPERETQAHVLVCGPTGCGKSSTIFIPNLIRRLETSAIVTEAVAGQRQPPTLYSKTAGWRAAAGHNIFRFDPADLSSVRINPLDSIRPQNDAAHEKDPDRLNFFESASYVANLIMTNTKEASPGEDKIWSQSEAHLLTSLLLYAVGLRTNPNGRAKEGDNANLGHIRAVLREGPEAVEKIVNTSPIRLAHAEFKAFLNNTSPNFRFGVVSGLMARLNSWVSPQIATLTEVTDFDPKALKDDLFTFYLSTLITRPAHKTVAVLAFNYLLEMLLDSQYKYPVTLLLDEFTNYGYIPEIEKKLAMVRNQGMGMVIGIQHIGQVKKLYKEDADVILSQTATRMFFRPRDLPTARLISDQLGFMTDAQRDIHGRGTKTVERPRKLLDESEVQRLSKREVIVFMPDGDPLKVRTFAPSQHDAFATQPPPMSPPHPVKDFVFQQCNTANEAPTWNDTAEKQRDEYIKQKAKAQQKKDEQQKMKEDLGPLEQTAQPEPKPERRSRFSDIKKRASRFDKDHDKGST